MQKNIFKLAAAVFIWAVFLSIGIYQLKELGHFNRLHEGITESDGFRQQPVPEEVYDCLSEQKDPGELLAGYWLDTNFGKEPWKNAYTTEAFEQCIRRWSEQENWNSYVSACRAIWDDLKYFPIPQPENPVKAEVSYIDSWMFERNYGGKRGHEGCDIMASENIRGYYPILSMTDGIIRHKGWLEQGGYRIGVVAPAGAYFYYAHLDSYANLEIGDTVKAGDLLGFMGDTGYSKIEGTTGNFPVHLHVGIYLTDTGKEISVNPYPALRYLETRKLKCIYERGRK